MGCSKCLELRQSIKKTPLVPGASGYPSIKELASMVYLEYFIQIGFLCIHEIPANEKVKDLIDYLDKKNWQMGTRTSYEGKIKYNSSIVNKNRIFFFYQGFYCTTFINGPEKKIVIVHRGTELDNFKQIAADIMILFKKVTKEVISKLDWHTTQTLMNNALKEQSNKFVKNDYSVTITGHSLGGWLAQISTLIAKNPEFHPFGPRGNISFGNGKSIDMNQSFDLHCVAFDSPGAFVEFNQLNLAAVLLGGKQIENAINSLDITVYLANPNPVNKCGKHVGIVKQIDVMSSSTFIAKWFIPAASHSMERILNYFIEN